jgi:hypothetical protein
MPRAARHPQVLKEGSLRSRRARSVQGVSPPSKLVVLMRFKKNSPDMLFWLEKKNLNVREMMAKVLA